MHGKVPEHIAFIMDGNSTWAKRNGQPIMDGYLKGMKNMAQVILDAQEIGVEYTTFYAFSMENWARPTQWVSDFMALALRFFQRDESIKRVLDAGAKIKAIGNTRRLSADLQEIIKKYEEKTARNEGITVQLAISYGSRDEIVRAVKKMIANGIEPTENNISRYLDTAGVPDPDLIIRTSSKKRLSNFLLWQSSYSELYFSDLLWPEFDKPELNKAIDDFSKRKRTYGK